MIMKNKYICVDFDGTIVTHKYPNIGEPVPLALETLKELQNAGSKIILLTMRGTKPYTHRVPKLVPLGGSDIMCEDVSYVKSDLLKEAVDYCADNGLILDAVNENPWYGAEWTNSRKVYGDIYIDDANAGCPLVYPESGRPYVDWTEIRKIFKMK